MHIRGTKELILRMLRVLAVRGFCFQVKFERQRLLGCFQGIPRAAISEA